MIPACPICPLSSEPSVTRTIVCYGYYRRKSDHRWIQRFKCKLCKKYFSNATHDICFRQLKRQFNQSVYEHLSSGVSQRRLAYLLRLNRKTIKRKFVFLGKLALLELKTRNLQFQKSICFEFDDLETFEHSKCKPLSVTLAVEEKTRRILGFAVAQMPCKGRLASKSLKKYGPRKDYRSQARRRLFKNLQNLVTPTAIIKSDQNPHYPNDVKKYFPQATHIAFKGRRGAIVGQGELKKIKFDPIFSLNHTCAKLRADINRLIRKTWCTTKLRKRLVLHLALYATYHNHSLLAKKRV